MAVMSADSRPPSTDVGASSYSVQERVTADQLVAENYELLVQIAQVKRRRSGVPATMATLDILHEGYLKLNGRTAWNSSEHFVRAASLAMRCVIVDYARKKNAQKRGVTPVRVSVDDESMLPEFTETPEQIVAIANLLEKMAKVNPRWMLVVDARYFAGMTEAETAEALNISTRSARRDWAGARAWLAQSLGVAP